VTECVLWARVQNDELRGESLLFRAGAHLCALPLAHVVETMRPLPIEPIAGGPRFVRGLAIVRGAPVPVVDLACLLNEGLSAREEARSGEEGGAPAARFVVLRVAGRSVALVVDGVVGVRALSAEALRELPPLLREARDTRESASDVDTSVIESVGTLDAELLLVLRSARLFAFEDPASAS
jgi:purine-binding chemotaxis protein CheW